MSFQWRHFNILSVVWYFTPFNQKFTLCNLCEYVVVHCIDLTGNYTYVFVWSPEKYLPLNCLYFSFLLLLSLFLFFFFSICLLSHCTRFLLFFFGTPVYTCIRNLDYVLNTHTSFYSKKICSKEAIATQTHQVNTKLIASEAKLMAQSTRSKPLKNRIAYTRTHLGHILFKRVFLSSVVNKIRK